MSLRMCNLDRWLGPKDRDAPPPAADPECVECEGEGCSDCIPWPDDEPRQSARNDRHDG